MVAVNSFRNLSNTDLQKVMCACEQLHCIDESTSFLHHCFGILQQSIGHVHCSVELYTLDPFVLTALENPTVSPDWITIFNRHVQDHPYVERMLSNKNRHLETIQQEVMLKTFKKSALYNEFYDKVQGQNQLWMAFRDGNELLSSIYLRETEYCDNELAMIHLIQPHMETAWKNWRRTRSLKQELDLLKGSIFQSEEAEAEAAQLRRMIDTLPSRQCDVVELVAAGKDNQQVSDELHISVGTVKKHLQLVFQTLDVQHRTQLAAQWHRAYSIQLR